MTALIRSDNSASQSCEPLIADSSPLPEPIRRPMEEIVDVVFRASPKRKDEWGYALKYRKSRSAD